MRKYIFSRLVQGVFTVFFIATATFFAMHLVPGDPLSSDKAMSEEIRANLEAKYGLDQPVIVQYGIFLKNMAKGDFGISYAQKNRYVNDIIAEHFPISALLGVLAILYAALGGILWGALTAKFRNKWPDHIIMIMVIFGISVPNFVVAALSGLGMVNINSIVGATVLPVAGWGTLSHMILPAMALGLGTMAYLTRLMRNTMLDVTNSDYIKTAKSKGLGPSRIFFKHELRNSVLPLITILGPAIAAITTGGFVVESIFAIPGLGKFFVEAVQQLDYTVIMGLTVFYGAFLVAMVIAVDVIYGFIDPRIRLAK
ncbi:MAG: ABC transporter permease [Bdellovibrionales bacterium]